jgi:hypothetical protein
MRRKIQFDHKRDNGDTHPLTGQRTKRESNGKINDTHAQLVELLLKRKRHEKSVEVLLSLRLMHSLWICRERCKFKTRTGLTGPEIRKMKVERQLE